MEDRTSLYTKFATHNIICIGTYLIFLIEFFLVKHGRGEFIHAYHLSMNIQTLI